MHNKGVIINIIGIIICCCLYYVQSQQVGTQQAENHPSLSIQQCSKNGGCQQQQRSVVLDANWRWIHTVNGYTNCYTGDNWDSNLCPDPRTCAQNCAIDGADYPGTYGITAGGASLSLKFVVKGQYDTNIGSRVYLLQDESTYQIFKLKNREFTFDVDVSNLPCGLNGALYFVEMPADGGASYPGNKAGAKYGTGYCDAQCPHDIKWIDGEANMLSWEPSPNNPNTGTGMYGSCCTEMDVWESNSVSSAYTPHVCTKPGAYRCNGTECGDGDNRYGGVCDKDGCDFNSFRMGVQNFYGPGNKVDTKHPFTVVTQFITNDNTDDGELVEIRRYYVQNGQVIPNSAVNFPGKLAPYDSVSDKFCVDQKNLFGDKNSFSNNGGLSSMGNALERGVVLVMSLWDDYAARMLWLDSNYPVDGNPSQPGVARGTCSTDSGVPSQVESEYPNAYVQYFNIKWGEINSTFTL